MLRWLIALAGAVVATIGFAGVTDAHTSNYCDHSSVSGANWRVTYVGYRNDPPTGGTGGYEARRHFHTNSHYYHGDYQHDKEKHCGYTDNTKRWDAECSICFPSIPDVDLPSLQAAAESTHFVELRRVLTPDYGYGMLGLVDVLVTRPGSGTCLIGATSAESAGLTGLGGWLVEYATPDIAASVGHPC